MVEDVGVLFGGEFPRGEGRFGFSADAFQSAEVGAVEAFFERIHCGCRRIWQALDAVSHALELALRQLVHRYAAVRQLLFQRRPFFRRRDFRRQCFKACTSRGGRIQTGIHRLLHRIGVVAHRFFGFRGDAGKDFVEVNADVRKSILRRFRRLLLRRFGLLRGVDSGFGLFVRFGDGCVRDFTRGINGNLGKAQYRLLGCFYGVGSGLWDLSEGGTGFFGGILCRPCDGFAAGTDGFARVVDDLQQRAARVVGNFVQAGETLQHGVRGAVSDAEKVAHRLSCAKDAERDVGGNLHDGGEDDTNSRKARLQSVQPDGERLKCPVERHAGCLQRAKPVTDFVHRRAKV